MPGIRNEHIDGPLSTFASAYEPPGYYADVMAPVVLVDHVSDEFHKRRRQDITTPHDDEIAEDGGANRSTFSLVKDTYVCRHRALKDVLSNADIDNADLAINLLEEATATLLNRMALNREIRVANLYATSANYVAGNTFTVGYKWDDEANGNPLVDLQRARRLLAPGGGAGATQVVLMCDEAVWDAVARHPSMRGGGNLSPVATPSEVAERLRVDRILISDAERNSANEGQAVSHTAIWNATKCWIARVPTGTVQRRQSAFAVTFRFRNGLRTAQRGPGVQGIAVRRWEDPGVGPYGSQVIQPSISDAEKPIQDDMAVMIEGVL